MESKQSTQAESDSSQIIARLIHKARVAQAQVATYTQEQIDNLCLSVGWEVYADENIEILARTAVETTGMGNVPDKIKKHKAKILGVLRDIKEAKSVGLIEEIPEKGIRKYAKPVGVVGALTPVTNPTATPGSNGLSILKGRNAVIFAPHPKSAVSSKLAVEYMRRGLARVGAPLDLIQIIEEPSIELTGELMRQVDLVLATGGGPMVKAAYSSGTPAYGVGPGNSVQIVAEDADPKDAAEKITMSKIFDNATSCSSENSVIIHESLYSQMVQLFQGLGGYLVTEKEKPRLQDHLWKTTPAGKKALNPAIIAQFARKIAQDAGLQVPESTTMLMVEGSMPLEDDLFSGEKISPVITLWKYKDFNHGLEILTRLTNNAGTGHSCGIHTYNRQYIDMLSESMNTSRIMVRQPQAPANGGNFFNGMPSTVTLGCGTWGGNITTENINYKHFLNITWVSEPIPVQKPTDQEMWGTFWDSFSKDVPQYPVEVPGQGLGKNHGALS